MFPDGSLGALGVSCMASEGSRGGSLDRGWDLCLKGEGLDLGLPSSAFHLRPFQGSPEEGKLRPHRSIPLARWNREGELRIPLSRLKKRHSERGSAEHSVGESEI